MSDLIDISPLISPRIGVWPGDTPFSQSYLCRIEEGSNIDLSAVTTTMHLGAHADAPSHYAKHGVGIDERPLSLYYGLCQVIHVQVSRGMRIMPDDVCAEIVAPRVLFRTGSFPDPDHFTTDFCSLSPELVHFLADKGVVLVGIDTPSVDPCTSKELESHQAIAMRDLAILEGIVLQNVQAGVYRLMAFPLRIEGADATPVRAVLEKLT